jgi:hypothetical protein
MSQHVLLYNPQGFGGVSFAEWLEIGSVFGFISHHRKMPLPNGTGKLKLDGTQHELSTLDSHHLRTITSARHCFFFSASASRRRPCATIHIQKASTQ